MTAQITQFSTTPSRANPSTFSSDMDTRILEENRFASEANAVAVEVNNLAAQVAAVATGNSQANWGYPASQSPAASQIPVVKSDGTTAFPGGISVGNANANGGSALLDWIEKNVTALLTVTAGISGTVTGNATLTRFGNLVFITLPLLTGSSSGANTFTISGIPSSFRPSAVRRCWLGGGVTDNSTASYGWVSVNTNGTLAVYHDPSGGAWLLTGTRALQTSMIAYEI